MSWLIRGWHRVLVALSALGLVLVACSSAASITDVGQEAAYQVEPAPAVNVNEYRATSSVESVGYLTINVEIADNSIQPASIDIPVGQRVLLVMRNRGKTEHHFHISGLVPKDMLWFSRESGDTETDDVNAAKHSEHNHGGLMAPYHICSPGSSICPTGNSVHTHAEAGGMDAIFFTTTNTGTFLAQCPLHPEMNAKVTVF